MHVILCEGGRLPQKTSGTFIWMKDMAATGGEPGVMASFRAQWVVPYQPAPYLYPYSAAMVIAESRILQIQNFRTFRLSQVFPIGAHLNNARDL